MEFARLIKRIAAGGCVDDEKHFVRRIWILLGQRAFYFLKLGHQIRFSMQSSGGIAQKKVDLLFGGDLICIVTKRGRIGIVLTADHFNSKAFRPNSELFDGGGAKRVGGGQENSRRVEERALS